MRERERERQMRRAIRKKDGWGDDGERRQEDSNGTFKEW